MALPAYPLTLLDSTHSALIDRSADARSFALYPGRLLFPHSTTPIRNLSCLVLLDIPRRLLQAVVALFVGPPRAETDADECGPRPPLEEKD